MKFIDVGDNAVGFIAIGQEATGVIAIGQVATGVIAIGQLARGGFCVGQLALGLVGWGQAGVGVFHAVGMVGIGGRGFGLVVPVVPSIGQRRVHPEVTDLERVRLGEEGWLRVTLESTEHGLRLASGEQLLPIKLDRRVFFEAEGLYDRRLRDVYAYTRRRGDVLVCDRIAYEPVRPYREPSWVPLAVMRLLLLLGLGVAYWLGVGNDLHAALAGLDAPPPPAQTAAAPTAAPPPPPAPMPVEPAPTAEAPTFPSRRPVPRDALQKAVMATQTCKKPGQASRQLTVTLTFDGPGAISSSTVEGPDGRPDPATSCVSAAFRKLKLPPDPTGRPQTVTVKFAL